MRIKSLPFIISLNLMILSYVTFSQIQPGRSLIRAAKTLRACPGSIKSFQSITFRVPTLTVEYIEETSDQILERYSIQINDLSESRQFAVRQQIIDDIASYSNTTSSNGFRASYESVLDMQTNYESLEMDRSEAAAVYNYTTNSEINNALRGYESWTSELRGFKYMLDEGLSKLPLMDEGISVFRGASSAEYESAQNWSIGDVIEFSDYKSTSTDIDVAKDFTVGKGNLIFEITSPKGVEIPEWLAEYPEENEVLISPPSKFVVVDIYEDANGLDHIILDQLDLQDIEPIFDLNFYNQEPKVYNLVRPLSLTDIISIIDISDFEVPD